MRIDQLLATADAYLSGRVVEHPLTDGERACSDALDAVVKARKMLAEAAHAQQPAAPLAMVSENELRDIQSGRMGVPVRGAGWRSDQTIAIYLAAPTAGAAMTSEDARDAALIEAEAEKIYSLFEGAKQHPWVKGGNSNKQDEARRLARAALAMRATQQEGGK